MPERPDLEYVVSRLNVELASARIHNAELHKPAVLRLALECSLQEALEGAEIVGVTRRLHFMSIELAAETPVELIVAPMLAGTLAVHSKGDGSKRDRAVTLYLEDGRELRYRDSKQMGKVYVLPRNRTDLIPGFNSVGIDVLDSEAFSFEAFESIARKRRDQVKVFLLDKAALDSFGNAYADEVLFEAGIHPKTYVRTLDEDELHRLYEAIPRVLENANAELRSRQPATDEKVRDFLKVRGRHKVPCERCGTQIRKAGVRGFDAFFCPSCQPETRKSGIVRWR